MQNIKSSDSKIEILLRSELHKRGIRFRKNSRSIIGKPDIVLPKYKMVIFLDSCFWHCCPYHGNIPTSNRAYWVPKLARNKIRAKEVNQKLREQGWKVIRIWEHRVKKDINKVIIRILATARQ